METSLITGITGQDAAYLAKLLLDQGHTVVGTFRRTSSTNFWRLEFLGIRAHPRLQLHEYDLTDPGAAVRMLTQCQPQTVYNLAAQSFVAVSFGQPVTTAQATGVGALNLLEAIRIVDPGIRFYQASSSEMFGKAQTMPQDEATAFHPRSPYGVAKLFAHWITLNYQESYGLFAACGILFNHESPLRGVEFVTRKITQAVARIQAGKQDRLILGNLEAQRDWGFAGDYVEGMYRIMTAESPETYVLATNVTTSVREFARMAFAAADIELTFEGEGVEEIGRDPAGAIRLSVNADYFRPAEVDLLRGDYAKASAALNWQPSTNVAQLVDMMVTADIDRARN